MDDLRNRIGAELGELIEIRHDLHRHPELSYEERRTCDVVCAELERLGIEHRRGLARGTGVVAHIPASDGGDRPAVALRADMDALPIDEQTGKPYASEHPGVMHACGHDGHTTILLGAARVLSKIEHRPQPVTLIFQPAEEGGAGGQAMCDDGALLGSAGGGLGPRVGRIFGLHGWPNMDLGHVGTRPGPLLAATDDFEVIIHGVEGHAAFPHLAHDPVLAASSCVVALQSIASRCVAPTGSVVVTVAAIHAGEANNVIPAQVRMVGTVRTLDEGVRRLARERFFEIVERTSEAHACRAHIDWQEGYPVTRNEEHLARHVLQVAARALGEERAELVPDAFMGGEDFSYYGQHVPACFFLLGLRPAGAGEVPQLHQATFDFNDDAIGVGVEMMCRLALDA